jgi:RNase H-fold protein (predicted Holliday junction resolvase)
LKKERTLLAIDPGSSKSGLAVVHRTSSGGIELRWRGIVPSSKISPKAKELLDLYGFQQLVVGSGTGSRAIVQSLREGMPGMGILLVDERDTTLKARERYWEHNPRKGWRRLLPATLQTPPEPIDDFAALVLAERVLIDSN